MSRIAITGANGYLGRHLAHYLAEAGHQVYAYDLQQSADPALPSEVVYRQTDLCQASALQGIDLEVDYVLHFAGITGTEQGFSDYRRYLDANELALLQLLDALRSRQNPAQLIFPSTRLVYRGSEAPLSEAAEKQCKTVYAVNKLAAEQYIQAYANRFGLRYTIFRICVPYGNRFDDSFSYGTIGHFLGRARRGETIRLFGDGLLRRTFTHVDHLCAQIATALSHPGAIDQVFNIGGETLSLKQAAQLIADRLQVAVEHVPWDSDALRIESGSTVFDSARIEAIVGQDRSYRLQDWVARLSAGERR
ncbi:MULTISPECIES: NAD-dependent epimerase/dehydratase family protein [Thiorhodovibrio]|uniref:NAD-dependent epimerase/dehydratase family protein n=1 Tax=Thiorhodovibrio TaxID=61593 RepID=UPI0019122755|nr:NAD(P)-dependent oxidoreductase [Thiorhodovibrio litoralis]MBK5970254.1 hypothetical protein [Thiorhodovibrio winogradskyi]WPL14818.1 GDP-6-deoxy-D-mannose reductase [Thiorhodovibrio litoralis]